MPARTTVIRRVLSMYAPAGGPMANFTRKMARPKSVGATSDWGLNVRSRSGVANSQPLEPSLVSVCESSR
eukprot:scaffold266089_cov32-Tisochrysis_lutea.AAC.1